MVYSLVRISMIAEKYNAVTQRIASICAKCGRPAGDVRLVCVTKEAEVAQMEEALAAGASIFGENRVQDALAKHRAIGARAGWHLIGHLQTNKAKDAVMIFGLIHSVDSLKLAREIDAQAARLGKIQDILIQVNTSGEASKFGVTPQEAEALIEEAGSLRNLSVKGLMTIAPETPDPETARPHFRALRELRDGLNKKWGEKWGQKWGQSPPRWIPQPGGQSPFLQPGGQGPFFALHDLSMGMTGDFEAAIEEGATLVRVGRAIFGQ